MKKALSQNITTLDLLKTFAVISMIIDHLGFCFFTEDFANPVGDPNLWYRAIGRLCVPIWFFLVGYSRSRDLSPPIWIAAIVMTGFHFVSGLYIFPTTVLVTIILIRLMLDRVATVAFRNWEHFAFVFFACLITFMHLGFVTEYGSVGLWLALAGFAIRHKGADYGLLKHKLLPSAMFWTSTALFCFSQFFFFMFDKWQMTLVCVGTAVLIQLMMNMKVREYPYMTKIFGPIWSGLLKFTGRRTMEIYVIHLMVFVTIAWLGGYGYNIYGWFDWEWTAIETFDKMRAAMKP